MCTFSASSAGPANALARCAAWRWLPRCRRGATAIEFALLALPLVALLIAIPEITWQLTTAAILDDAVLRASRFGVTGQATRPGEPPQFTCRSQTIAWIITSSAGGFLKSEHLTVTTGTFPSASGVSGGITVTGAGNGGQVVTYTATYEQPSLTGAFLNFGGWDRMVHRASIVVKNEPFDNATC
jgi:Flp pilus assembly protein TadG